MVSAINSAVYLRGNLPSVQIELLNILLQKQPKKIREGAINTFLARSKRYSDRDTVVFSRLINLKILEKTLISPFVYSKALDTTAEQELHFFMGYLLYMEYNEEEGLKILQKTSIDNDLDYFQNFAWSLMEHLGASYNVNPIIGAIKNVCIMNELKKNSDTSEFVSDYLEYLGVGHLWSLVSIFFEIISKVWDDTETGLVKPNIQVPDELLKMFDDFSIKLDELPDRSKTQRRRINLKAFPVVHSNNNIFIVLDWNHFLNKIHYGLIFDFYKHSGISKLDKFKNFPLFKKHVGYEIIEKFIFRKLILSIFPQKARFIFNPEDKDGFPDAYVRKGNSLFLFELKDSLFSESVMNTKDFRKVREELNLKFNNPKKGTGQLLKQIELLQKSSYENSQFEKINIKRRNITIYPIIVYTDLYFETPGFGYHLKKEFDLGLTSFDTKIFREIKPLAFMNLNFMIDNFDFFESRRNRFQDVLNYYKHQIKRREKNYTKRNTTISLDKLNDPFEQIVRGKLDLNNKKLSRKMFEALELSYGLPEE